MGFLNIKISTITGIIVILLIASTVGCFIIWQANQVMKIRIETMEKYSGVTF